MADMRHTLDKKTASRHYPEWEHGGKGQHPRRSTKSSRDAYSVGYDRIFRKSNSKDNTNGNNSSS
jgi:hypothetical protein